MMSVSKVKMHRVIHGTIMSISTARGTKFHESKIRLFKNFVGKLYLLEK